MKTFTPSRLSTILLAALLVASAGAMAFAADSGKAKTKTKVLGTFQDWKAFSYEERGQKVCYVSSQPKKISPKGKARGDAYILITHRPSEKTFGVVSITAGYTYKKGSEVQVKIDRNSFKLFTDGDTAWARDETSDKALSSAIKSGKSLVVKGISARGTKTSDNYSLSGAGPVVSPGSTRLCTSRRVPGSRRSGRVNAQRAAMRPTACQSPRMPVRRTVPGSGGVK